MVDTEFVAWSHTRFAGPTMGTYSCLLSTTTARFAGTGLIVWLALGPQAKRSSQDTGWSSRPGLTSQDGEPYFVAVAGVGAASSCSA